MYIEIIMLNSSWIKLFFSFLYIFAVIQISLFFLKSQDPHYIKGLPSEHKDLLNYVLIHCQSEFIALVVALCNLFSTWLQCQYISSFSDEWLVVWFDLNVKEFIELYWPVETLYFEPNVLLLIVWVTLNVGKNFCCSFLNNHVSTEVVNNIDVLNIFQKSSADFDEIQNETQWEFLRQIIDFN